MDAALDARNDCHDQIEGLVVRGVEEPDLDALLALGSECFPSEQWTREGLLAEIGNDAALCFLAEVRGDVVGFIVVTAILDEAHLLQIATSPKYRRLGAAKLLLSHVREGLASMGVTSIFLEVRASNEAALKLYERFGFSRLAIRRGYYARPREDACVMRGETGKKSIYVAR